MSVTKIKYEAKCDLKNHRIFAQCGVWVILLLALLNMAGLQGIRLLYSEKGITLGVKLCLEIAIFVLSESAISSALLGFEAWRFRLLQKKEASIWQIIFWFTGGRSVKALALHIAIWGRKILWMIPASPGVIILYFCTKYARDDPAFYIFLIGGCVCVFVGIIFHLFVTQRYALCRLLCAMHPKRSVRQIVRDSVQCMNGKCMRMVWFKLSFILSRIACIAVVPAPIVIPVYRQSLLRYTHEILQDCSVPNETND